MNYRLITHAIPGAILLGIGIYGCGGGASIEPTVTIKLAEVEEIVAKTGTADAVAAKGFGTFSGRVVFSGTKPSSAALFAKGSAPKDGTVCAADGDLPNESLLTPNGDGVQNVFIYIRRVPDGNFGSFKVPADFVFDQEKCVFKPHALIVPCDFQLPIWNSDRIPHNTNTKPVKNNPFNRLLPPDTKSSSTTLVYTKVESEPVSVGCDYHAWMQAYHLPVDHPFAALTDENGAFKIEGLPSGTHQFQVWHESADGGYIERGMKVAIRADESTEMTITYDSSKLK
ncbi:MAG: carboxypeptidase regulatory-like domain-containing protein [Planctomycetota bacterium]|nr:carboxypeptidase regulatory-like domain-containing protein [Planctomycetota bacterium]